MTTPSGDGGLAARLEAAVAFLSRLGVALGAIAVLAAFALVTVAVALRYLFNRPLNWSDEVTGWLIVATVMLSIAEVQRRGGNIGVDLLTDKAGGRLRRALELLGVATVATCALLLSAQGYETVAFSKLMGLKSNTLGWVDTWLVQLLVPVGSALLLLVALMQLLLLAMGRRPRDFDSETHLSRLRMTFLLILAALIGLLYFGMPMFAGMLLFSCAVLWAVEGSVGTLGDFVFSHINVFLLVAIPLFMLMAHFMVRGRLVDDLYSAAHSLVRHLPGGLGIATVAACAVFAAVSGSSVATALTIGAVAIPQMLRYGYDPRGAYGVVAAGGTLGILIPPSAPMILYGVAADVSIGALFMAGLLPGLMLAAIFAGWCVLTEKRREIRLGTGYTRPPRATAAEMLRALRRSVWALLLPPLVLGGIYFGIFTPTEAAAIGAMLALIVAVFVYRQFGWRDLWEGAQEASRTTAMLFFIIIGAAIFGHMLTILRIPDQLVRLVVDYRLGQLEFILAMMAVIFILGLILESVSIILITTPVILPVLTHLGIDKIWYGVLLTINLELALISPPVGLNLIVIKNIAKVPLHEVDRAAIPYILLMFLGMAILIAWPGIATWLPSTMQLGR